jgi:hypothetical protein
MEHHLRVMASKDCVLSFRISDPNYRTKQMASCDSRDPWVTGQQIGTQSLKHDLFYPFVQILWGTGLSAIFAVTGLSSYFYVEIIPGPKLNARKNFF